MRKKEEESKKPERRTLAQIYEESNIGVGNKMLKHIWEENRNIIIIAVGIMLLVACTISGWFWEWVLNLNGEVEGYSLFWMPLLGIRHIIFPTSFLFLFFVAIFYRFSWTLKGTRLDYDTDRNYAESSEKTAGSAEKMKEEERDRNFDHGDYAKLNGDPDENGKCRRSDIIFGADVDNPLIKYVLKENYGINHNIILFGSPGAGKSRCYAIPLIMQCIRMGRSVVVTDPKVDLYNKTAAMLRANGYVVKLINLNPERILHSDSVDLMGTVGKKPVMAQSFAETVLTNIYGDDMDFWGDSEMNLFIASLLFIPGNAAGYEENLAGVYKLLNNNSVQELEDLFSQLPDDHPAVYSFNTYANGDNTVKGNTLAGLQIHLSKLQDPAIQKVLATPDVDLSLPGKQKCAYFIGMSDQDRSLSWAVALIFTLIFQQLVLYADEQPNSELPVTVEMLLDEFYNIGRIPAFDSKISTMRSRGINCHVILQSLAQLQTMYPNALWDAVLECFHVQILLRTNSLTTAEYFSKRAGVGTAKDRGVRYNEAQGDVYHLHGDLTISESNKARNVYTADEVLRIPYDKELVFIGSGNAMEMKKVDFTDHPMCKEMRKVNGAHHLPKWVRDLEDEEFEELGAYDEFEAGKYEDEEKQIKEWNIELCTEEDFLEPWNKEKEERLQRRIKNMSRHEVEEEFGGTYDNVDEDDFYARDFDADNKLFQQAKKESKYQKELAQYQRDQKNGIVSDVARVKSNRRMMDMGQGANPRTMVTREKNERAGRDATTHRSKPVDISERKQTVHMEKVNSEHTANNHEKPKKKYTRQESGSTNDISQADIKATSNNGVFSLFDD